MKKSIKSATVSAKANDAKAVSLGVPSISAASAVLVVAPETPRVPTVAKVSFPETARIVVVSTANPKRPGSKAAAKFPLYAGANTVADLIAAFAKAGFPRRRALSALRWDSARGFIKIG